MVSDHGSICSTLPRLCPCSNRSSSLARGVVVRDNTEFVGIDKGSNCGVMVKAIGSEVFCGAW